MIHGGEMATVGACHLTVFSVDVVFAATSWLPPPLLHNRRANGICYANKIHLKWWPIQPAIYTQ